MEWTLNILKDWFISSFWEIIFWLKQNSEIKFKKCKISWNNYKDFKEFLNGWILIYKFKSIMNYQHC